MQSHPRVLAPPTRRLPVAVAFAAVVSLIAATAAIAAPPGGTAAGGIAPAPPGAELVADSYIVLVDTEHPGAVAFEHARRHGVEIAFIYEHAVTGYAATMSRTASQAIARDPRVVRVEQETLESITAQELPTGIDRIDADRNPTITTDGASDGNTAVAIDIAVIDTGVSKHPDLNLETSTDCTERSGGGPFATYSCRTNSGDDTNGHGTHVAGTIAAKDNGIGVVGVAPGALIHSVKVCPNNSCPTGAIIAGIDWVAEQKSAAHDDDKKTGQGIDFAAANFSISSQDSEASCKEATIATHKAICGLVDTGVSFVMAAGNAGVEKVPYPVALSVSAIADFDGLAGGTGTPTCRSDEDDTLANFSNYGDKVRIAAPGVCILSTWNDGGYNTISGTSMAAPHVAGAVALYIHAHAPVVPAKSAQGVSDIEAAIIGAALPQGTSEKNPCSYDDTRAGGPLLFVNASAFGGNGSCGIAGDDSGSTDPTEPVAPTASFTSACEGLTCTFTSTSTAAQDATYGWTFGDNNGGTGDLVTHAYAGDGTYTVELTVTDGGGTHSTSGNVTVAAPTGGGGEPGAATYDLQIIDNSNRNWFRAEVELVVTGIETVSDEVLEGTWKGDLKGSGSCTTSSDGTCRIDLGRDRGGTGTVTFTATSPSGLDPVTLDTR